MEGFMLIMTDFVQILEHWVYAAHEHLMSMKYDDEQYFGPCLESVIISRKARVYILEFCSII